MKINFANNFIIIKRGLLYASITSFVLAVVLYGSHQIFPSLPIPDRLVPDSLLASIVPPLTLLLIYEAVLLAAATRYSLVQFVRRQYELLSLILVRDVFKQLDQLGHTSAASWGLMLEIGVTAMGGLALYFLSELIQRVQTSYDNATQQSEPLGLQRFRAWLSGTLVALIIIVSAAITIPWLGGYPYANFDNTLFSALFALLAAGSMILFLVSVVFIEGYEALFEYSALLLASVTAILALSLHPFMKTPLILGASLFTLATLLLHGFARGKKT